MATYLIIPLESTTINKELEDRIDTVIKNSSDKFIFPNKNACLVTFNGISTELRDQLHLSGSAPEDKEKFEPIAASIFFVAPGGFNGYGPSQLWEWLTVKSK